MVARTIHMTAMCITAQTMLRKKKNYEKDWKFVNDILKMLYLLMLLSSSIVTKRH
jgi:hypothetical protein